MISAELQGLLAAAEGSRLEFKEAAKRFNFDELVRYCVTIANEGGGKIIFGVTNTRPRLIVGTAAFTEPGQTEASIYQRIGHHVSVVESIQAGRRVVVVTVPGRLAGTAWNDRGTYWMRAGEALVPMSDERLRAIHAEAAPDFSGEICPGARLQDLVPTAIGGVQTPVGSPGE